jgi:hypothetical protein
VYPVSAAILAAVPGLAAALEAYVAEDPRRSAPVSRSAS